MHLYVATTNQGKLRDFANALTPPEQARHTLDPLPGLAELEAPEETGETFEANARLKALYYSQQSPGKHILADDSGLEVDALAGAPGVRSARFADDRHFTTNRPLPQDQRNNLCLLDALASTRESQRGARYRCALALALDGVIIATSEGTVEGEILAVPRGSAGFGYDPLFLLPEEGQTMAEITIDQRRQHSHRTRALSQLLAQL